MNKGLAILSLIEFSSVAVLALVIVIQFRLQRHERRHIISRLHQRYQEMREDRHYMRERLEVAEAMRQPDGSGGDVTLMFLVAVDWNGRLAIVGRN